MRQLALSLVFFLIVFCNSTVLSASPLSEQDQIPTVQHQPPSPGEERTPDEEHAKMEREMAKKRNQERQAQLKRDTDQLLKLATELKEYVDKTNENILSMDVIKKADEIEKLAHSVKEKMRVSN